METKPGQRYLLKAIAERVMIERGLQPHFSPAALAEADRIQGPTLNSFPSARDLRSLLWCSIDNDDSRDLDQLTVAEALSDGAVKILTAIADVDSLIKKESAIDSHAGQNTTSVYTAAEIFPMLPIKFSTDFTSLNFDCDRDAVVIEMIFSEEGMLRGSDVYAALVRNRAKLAYNSVADWLENGAPAPPALLAVKGLDENLRLQDSVARKLKNLRHQSGALDIETVEARPVFDGDQIKDLAAEKKNRAKSIIEDFMVAANGVTARFLASKAYPSLRRVVRVPKRWSRIVEIAKERGKILPAAPDSKALSVFLTEAKTADPVGFPDLCLSIVKLLGPGEYVVETAGSGAAGHFGLAVKDYTHSTAPNRRYPDLITQRLLKSAINGNTCPYTMTELGAIARHCTEAENAAEKVERQVRKSAAALLLQPRIGERFDAMVTGAGEKGTWVRLFRPPVEGRLECATGSVDVGHKINVRLVSVDVQQGYIDFKIA